MTEPPLTARDIVALLRDPGVIDAGTAHRLEARIIAYGKSCAEDGRNDGIRTCARRAAASAAGLKGASQRAGAEKVLRALERLLPFGGADQKEAYLRGVKFGVELQLNRQRQEREPK
jgi:hypothetical protein